MRSVHKAVATVASVAVVAAGSFVAGHAAQPALPTSVCHYRLGGALPDPVCTPGATNPDVTQGTIRKTICVSGWTKTVRPPVSVTNRMKRISMAEYGFTGSPRDVEYDHLISLQLGGAPEDPRNLFPEPYDVPNDNNDLGARNKDVVESRLKREICAGRMTLTEAQRIIATDWRQGRG